MKNVVFTIAFLATLAVNAQVGVGTASPDASAALDIESTTSGMLIPRMTTTERDAISSPATGLMVYNTTTGEFEFYTGGVWTSLVPEDERSKWLNNTTNGRIELPYQSNGTTVRTGNNLFVIKNDGKVGIGTDSPDGHFQVSNTTTVNLDLHSGGSGRAQMRLWNGGSHGWNVGIMEPGTSINGNGFVIRDITNNKDYFRISTNGEFGMNINPDVNYRLKVGGSVGATSFLTTSDLRLKSQIDKIENALEVINQLRPVSYFKNDGFNTVDENSHFEYGFIAQQVQQVLPQIVKGEETDSTYLSLDYNSFIAILTRGVQEQQATIELQQNQLEALNERLSRLEAEPENATASFGLSNVLLIGGLIALVLGMTFRSRYLKSSMS